MTKKSECMRIYPSERAKYPNLLSKTELKKRKLMPAVNVKPRAIVKRKYYSDYYLYPLEKTVPYKLTKKEKYLNKLKSKLYREKHTCKVCKNFFTDKELYYDDIKNETYYYICSDCYKKIYDINRNKYIENILDKKIICIDVETTGVERNDEILQISIIDQNNSYCKPEHITNWPEAVSINNI